MKIINRKETNLNSLSLPPSAVTLIASLKPPNSTKPCMITIATPRNIRMHCKTSVQITALIPPTEV